MSPDQISANPMSDNMLLADDYLETVSNLEITSVQDDSESTTSDDTTSSVCSTSSDSTQSTRSRPKVPLLPRSLGTLRKFNSQRNNASNKVTSQKKDLKRQNGQIGSRTNGRPYQTNGIANGMSSQRSPSSSSGSSTSLTARRTKKKAQGHHKPAIHNKQPQSSTNNHSSSNTHQRAVVENTKYIVNSQSDANILIKTDCTQGSATKCNAPEAPSVSKSTLASVDTNKRQQNKLEMSPNVIITVTDSAKSGTHSTAQNLDKTSDHTQVSAQSSQHTGTHTGVSNQSSQRTFVSKTD